VPALSVVALFSFTLAWNEFMYAVVLSQSVTVMPLTAALSGMQAQDIFFWGTMMAMSLLMAIPPVVLYIIAQRWIIGGLMIGAVKG
jgi:ABC-type glycerol-3-phosphate transport system permease component